MAEVKKRQKQMSLSEKIKTSTKMKDLHLEEKVLQEQNTRRQALLEPLQEKAEQLVMEGDAAKRSIEQIGFEGGEILQYPIMA
jgi:Fe-S cluster assembly ATPase SufC